MAECYLDMNYKLNLTEREMRLVGLGLARKLTRAEDIKAAADLNVRLVKNQKIRIGEQDAKISGTLRLAEEMNSAIAAVLPDESDQPG